MKLNKYLDRIIIVGLIVVIYYIILNKFNYPYQENIFASSCVLSSLIMFKISPSVIDSVFDYIMYFIIQGSVVFILFVIHDYFKMDYINHTAGIVCICFLFFVKKEKRI